MAESKKLRVLIISSANPTKGPGVVALNGYNALKKYGHEVDLLTLYQVKDHPDFISVYNYLEEGKRYFFIEVKNKFNRLFRRLKIRQSYEHCFFYRKETIPPVSVHKILRCIEKRYDVVYIYFWQRMLSYQTIEAIYQKLHCQIHFRSVDYSPMSGGCHFTGSCEKYKTACGACPGIFSSNKNDFTAFNVKYRANVLEKVRPIVWGNNYMLTFYKQSFLFKGYNRLEVSYPLIDNIVFSPKDKEALRKEFNIPVHKRFLLFFGAQNLNDKRKGISYLLEALKIFHDRLSEKGRDSILLLLAGRDIEPIKEKLQFEYRHLGYVSPEELPKIYSLANVFLSPSVNDAGPLMVNQSLSCGTPVVAFEMGTALDMVKDKGTGYCAKLCDATEYAIGIESVYKLSKDDYEKMSRRCREVALELTSEEAFIRNFEDAYKKYDEK
jgi:glycosyltransferase involved in cell wall biosynthesis